MKDYTLTRFLTPPSFTRGRGVKYGSRGQVTGHYTSPTQQHTTATPPHTTTRLYAAPFILIKTHESRCCSALAHSFFSPFFQCIATFYTHGDLACILTTFVCLSLVYQAWEGRRTSGGGGKVWLVGVSEKL